MAIDFHAHLDLYPNPFEIAEECAKRNMYVLSVTTTPKAWRGTIRLQGKHKRIKTALGFHPQLVEKRFNELPLFEQILPEARYIGEIGMDSSREFKDSFALQRKVFKHILKCVDRAGGRIMSIHSRGCVKEVISELKGIAGIPVLHWFTGDQKQLKEAIDIGCWFSVGPAMMNRSNSLEIISLIPKDRILTETDGPFAKFNSRPLFPWDVEIVLKGLSDLWKLKLVEVKEQVLQNLKELTTKM